MYVETRVLSVLSELCRIHVLEIVVGTYLLFCSSMDYFFSGKNHFYVYLFLQAMAFYTMGFGYIGTIVPS